MADAPKAIPFIKDFPFAYGEPAQLSSLIRRVIAKNPGPFTYSGTGTYIVGDGDPLAVIDPGPDDQAHLDALVSAIGAKSVSAILITHTHRDHCGGARAFAARVGAPLIGAAAHPGAREETEGPSIEEGVDRDYHPDRVLADGETVSGDGWTLEAVATPGHVSNHLCFALKEEKALFTGDHIMGWATTVVAPPDGDMGDYFRSLEKLLARDDRIYYPTHGAPIGNPHRFVRAVRAHRRIRDGQILEQLRQGRSYIKDITPAMYADIDKRLLGAAALNVYAHLIRLVKEGDVLTEGAPSMKGAYRLAKN